MINGMKSLMERIGQYEKVSLQQAVGKSIGHVQAAAKENCPVNDGELRSSIFTMVEAESGGWSAIGTCYTNKEYATFVEFGTGPKGQENHNGISPNVAVAYTQSPWWIHESQIDKAAEKYHWFSLDTPDGTFYQCTGQAAQPYMYPALKNNEERVVQIVWDDIRRQLK